MTQSFHQGNCVDAINQATMLRKRDASWKVEENVSSIWDELSLTSQQDIQMEMSRRLGTDAP